MARHWSGKKRTLVISDGAACYPGLRKHYKLLHLHCSHRKNEFVKTACRCDGNVQIHTGTIDGVWKLLKAAIPEQPLSKTPKTSELNKTLWRYARCWQWRWEIQKVGEATGKLLAEMAQL